MIGQECIDELADFAGIKDQIAAITERAMQGELDFAEALTERVRLLLAGWVRRRDPAVPRSAQFRDMPGAQRRWWRRSRLAWLRDRAGYRRLSPVCRSGGRAAGVRAGRWPTGWKCRGGQADRRAGWRYRRQLRSRKLWCWRRRLKPRIRRGKISLATGDGANDIPMLVRLPTYGMAYHAKPKARAAAGWLDDRGDLTDVLRLLGIARGDWVESLGRGPWSPPFRSRPQSSGPARPDAIAKAIPAYGSSRPSTTRPKYVNAKMNHSQWIPSVCSRFQFLPSARMAASFDVSAIRYMIA